jgi:sugar O-acyltransferase (sialic acid O-acetyltransferase NeuD family)
MTINLYEFEAMKNTCIILGAGGHTRVLLDCLLQTPNVEIAGILDPDPELIGKSLFEIPVLGNDDLLSSVKAKGVRFFVIGVGGTGNNRPRMKLFELAIKHDLIPLTVRHPNAIISNRSKVGVGCQLLPGCIVNAGTQLGFNTIVNSGAIVEHDCVIGNHVHIATGATLASSIHVGDGAHIGAGAIIRQCIQIGEYVIVGAGAVVVKDVPGHTTVIGVPAKEIQKGKS